MLTSWVSDLVYMLGELIKDAQWYIYYLITFNWDYRDYYWKRIVQDARLIADKIANKANEAYESAKSWAKDRYDWAKSQIGPLWDSFVAVWTRFGAAFLAGAWTVVSWVEDKTTAVVQWTMTAYEEAKKWASDAWKWVRLKGIEVWEWISEKSGEVWKWITTKSASTWEWIDEKSGEVWDWIIGVAPEVEEWYDEQHSWLSDLYTNKREELAVFLDDPGRYIADWVADSAEYIIAECVHRFW